jgi:uncharacterized repeat protein (TIGR02543 family)
LGLFPAAALAAGNWTDGYTPNAGYAFSGGDGLSGTPYQISTDIDLTQLAVNVNSGINYNGIYFAMTDSIDLSGKDWTPIGTDTNPFSGHLIGNSYSIYDFTIDNPTGSYIGLFGRVQGGSIEDLIVMGKIEGQDKVGLIAGFCSDAQISTSIALGTVTGSGSKIGGFVGCSDGSQFEQCYALGAVTGDSEVGGFVGHTYGDVINTTFTNCFARGSVLSTLSDNGWYAGSFAGNISDSDFDSCYGSGIVGFSAQTGSYIGGFAGGMSVVRTAPTFTACYYDQTRNNTEAIGLNEGGSQALAGITGLSTENMQGEDALDAGKMDDLDAVSSVWYALSDFYPGFEPEPFFSTVSFQTNGGTFIPSQVLEGDLVTDSHPSKTGFVFGGWYSDDDLTTQWNFEDMPYGDITLHAKWTPAAYAVTFISNGGIAVAGQTITYGNKVTKPADPVRIGYTFAGWYSDEALTDLWDFNTDTVTDATTLYAKWTATPVPTPTPIATPVPIATPSPSTAVLSVSPDTKSIFVGGRVTLVPSQTGGTWQYDTEYLSLAQNTDGSATVTGVKQGTTTVTYVLGSTSVHASITISATELPETGQDFILPFIIGGIAIIGFAAALLIGLRYHRHRAS